MIYQGNAREQVDKIYELAQKHKEHPGYVVHCGHDEGFWEAFKKADFGDVIFCGRCCQYSAIIKHSMRINYDGRDKDGGVKSHLWNCDSKWAYRVHVRIT